MIPTDLAPSILQGHVLDRLRELPSESVQCVVTSPPFWGLRRYDVCGCAQDYVRSEGRSDEGGSMPSKADGAVRLKEPDPNCRWCHGTGKVEGMEDVLWGGSATCDHQLVETKPRRPREVDDAGGTISKGNRGASYGAAGGKRCVKCDGWLGQLGLEPTVQEYVAHLTLVCRDIRRVLRDTGIFWLEIGDSYVRHPAGLVGEARWAASTLTNESHEGAEQAGSLDKRTTGLREKNLALVPERLIVSLQEDGWIVRSKPIWWKRNAMPEPARDRPSVDYTHIYMLTKRPEYFADMEAVKVPANGGHSWGKAVASGDGKMGEENSTTRSKPSWYASMKAQVPPGAPRNLRTVWDISAKGYSGAHFATFPPELPERCIRASTKPGGLVLDPFAGSGTTLAEAKRLGRRSIGIELNPAYVALIRDRVAEARTETAYNPAQRRLAEFVGA